MTTRSASWRNRLVGSGEQPASQFIANPANWRLHPQAQQDALEGVLREVGWVQNVIVNRRTGHLVDGHQRVLSALKAGDATPVPYVEIDVSPEEEALILATLDPIAAMAGTDKAQLAAVLDAVQSGEAGVQAMLSQLAEDAGIVDLGAKGGLTDPDVAPAMRATDIQRGDLFQLGRHRLLCGDCTNVEDVARVMGGQRAALMATDPPYGIGYKYASHDDSDSKANGDLVLAAFDNAPNARVWTPGKMNLARELAVYPSAKVLCWHKKFSAAGNGLGGASTWEPVLVHGVDHADLPNDYLEHMTDRVPGLRDKHPCPKPVSLWAELVRAFSKQVDIVYEPFGGSGTTIIACEQLNRRCYGIEIEPSYCQVIIDRWEAFTGQTATKIAALHSVNA